MPRPRRTPDQKAETAALVNRLVELSGVTSNVDYAELTGLPESNVSQYRSGSKVPDGYTLLVMMRAVSGDELEALGAAVGRSVTRAPLVPRRELQAVVGDLAEWQPEVIAKLEQLEKRLEQLEIGRPSRRTPSRARKTAAGGP